MMSIRKILVTHPRAVAAIAVLLIGAVLLWQFRQARRKAALAELPTVATSSLEPGMAAIIEESRAAVLNAPYSGRSWGKLGMVLLAQDFLSEAVICLARAERLERGEVRWPYMRGLCLERQDPEAAIACFQKATEIRSDLALPKVQLAEMLLGRGQLQEAERQLNQAELLAPRDSRVLLCLGRLAFLRDQLDEALRRTEDAVQLDPHRRRIRLLLCQILERRGDQEAVEEQLRVLESIPETGAGNEWPDPILAEVSQYKRGIMWTLQVATQQIFAGQIPQAIALLEQAGGQEAADVRIIVLLGKAYLRSEQLDKAEPILQRALEKDPSSAPAHFEMGNLAMVSGRWNDAAEQYRETIRLQPDLAAAHYNLGLYHQHRGEREQAIAAFKKACRHMPTNFPAHRELAQSLLELGQRDEALEHLDSAAKLVPNDPKLLELIERARASSPPAP